jgi:hypothetical protein
MEVKKWEQRVYMQLYIDKREVLLRCTERSCEATTLPDIYTRSSPSD